MPAKTVGGFGHIGDETRVVDVAVLTSAHGRCSGEELQEVSADLRPNPRQSKEINEAQSHLDQNVLDRYAAVAQGPRFWAYRVASFPLPHGPVNACNPIWRKRGTRKSGLETNTENKARSALLARLWCHLPLQNPANRAENLIRLCSATIGQTGWRMVQVGAIRSRQKAVQLLAEILKKKNKWRFRRFRVSRIS